jgi:hypothetical protein
MLPRLLYAMIFMLKSSVWLFFNKNKLPMKLREAGLQFQKIWLQFSTDYVYHNETQNSKQGGAIRVEEYWK